MEGEKKKREKGKGNGNGETARESAGQEGEEINQVGVGSTRGSVRPEVLVGVGDRRFSIGLSK